MLYRSKTDRVLHPVILMATRSGLPARQITTYPVEEVGSVWPPDGRSISLTSRRSGNRDIWIVGAEGGEGRQVTYDPADETVYDWSQDGQWLVFGSGLKLLRVLAEGGEREPLGEGSIAFIWARFSSDDGAHYFVGQGELGSKLWALSLEDGSRNPVTNLAGRAGSMAWGVGTDGECLYFTWTEETGDLWGMDVEVARN